MKTFTTFSLILLSTSAYALPAALGKGNFTVPFSLTWPKGTGAYLKGAADATRARARFLQSRTPIGPSTVPVLSALAHFIVEVGVGNPAKYHHLVIDTGSSFTWFKEYYAEKSISSKFTGEKVSAMYLRGASIQGSEYLDKVTLAPGLVITSQSIGSVESISLNLDHVDGILGLGPVELTKGMLHSNMDASIPTVMNNLKSEEQVTEEVFSVYLPPIASPDSTKTKGRLTYGGIDTRFYRGDLTYLPLTTTSPASKYWGLDLSLCMYGDNTQIISTESTQTPIAGIVDTGVQTILIPDDFFELYRKAIPGAVLDKATKLIEIPHSSIQHMQPLHFTFGDHKFTLNGNEQLVPQGMNIVWGGDAEKHYGFVGPIGSTGRHGLDFILGVPFMVKYYTVHDADNKRIGFAEAKPLATLPNHGG